MNYLSYDTVKYFFKGVKRFSRDKLSQNNNGYKLKNLCVSSGIWGLSVWGSISKYKNGNNVESFHPSCFTLVTQQICDELNIAPYLTNITRLDSAITIEMDEPIHKYLSLLFSMNRMKNKIYVNESIIFYNKIRTFSFYDKIKELKKQDTDNAHNYQGYNLLRIELQLKRLRNWKGCSIYDSDLSDPQFYKDLVQYFQAHYTKVHKNASNIINLLKSNKREEFLAGLVLQSIVSQGDPYKVLKYDNKRSYTYRKHRRIIEDIIGEYTTPEQNILLEEMDTKIRDVCNNSLSLFK